MRKHSAFLFGVVMLCLACAALAEDSAVRKELDADYAKFVAGFKKKELKEHLSLLTPDFTMTMNGHTEDRKQAEVALQRQLTQVDKMSMKIQSLSVKENLAVATVQRDMAGTVTLESKPHVLAVSGLSKDTWIKTPQGWRLKNEEILKPTYTLDGKPFDPTASPKKK